MRSILDIVIAVKECQPATEEELRLCVVALSHMLFSVEREERQLIEGILENKPSMKMRAEFAKKEKEIRFQAKKKPVTKYLGKHYTPGTPENLKLAAMARAVFKKATGEGL